MSKREFQQAVLANIDKFGWHASGVLGEGTQPPWLYSVGLTAVDHPELVVFGLDHTTAHGLINTLVDRVLQKGEKLAPGPVGEVAFTVTKDGPVEARTWLIPVRDPRNKKYPLGVALGVYGDKVSGLQLVLPDDHNRLPWQDGYSDDPRLQPLLGAAPEAD